MNETGLAGDGKRLCDEAAEEERGEEQRRRKRRQRENGQRHRRIKRGKPATAKEGLPLPCFILDPRQVGTWCTIMKGDTGKSDTDFVS